MSTAGGLVASVLGKVGLSAAPVAAALAGIAVVGYKVYKAWKEANPTLEELNAEISDYNSQLQTNYERLEELQSIPYRNLTPELKAEIEALKEENEELSKLLENRQKLANDKFYENLQKQYATAQEIRFTGLSSSDNEVLAQQLEYGLAAGAQYDWETLKDILEDIGITFEDNVDSVYAFSDALKAMGISFETVSYGSSDFDKSLQNIEKEYNYYANLIQSGQQLTDEQRDRFIELTSTMTALSAELEVTNQNGTKLTEVQRNFITLVNNSTQSRKDLIAETYRLSDSVDGYSAMLVDALSGMKLNATQVDVLKSKYPELEFEVDQLTGMYDLNKQSLIENASQHEVWANTIIEQTKKAISEAIEWQLKYRRTMVDSAAEAYQAYQKGSISYEEYLDARDLAVAEQKRYEELVNLRNELQLYEKYGYPITEDSSTSDEDAADGGGSSGQQLTADELRKKMLDAQLESYNESVRVLEHEAFLLEKNGASEEERIEKYKELQKLAHQKANIFRKLGEGEESEYIQTLQENWWGYADTIDSIEEDITQRQRDAFDERLKDSEEWIEQRNELDDWGADNEIDAWNRVVKWMDEWYEQGLIDYEYYLEARLKATQNAAAAEQKAWEEFWDEQEEQWEAQHEALIDSLNQRKDAYEALFDLVADKAQEEIDVLEEERQAIEDRYQAQIDELNKVNEELENQIALEEALDAVARARQTKVMVYKDGRFQYINDIDEVSEAQANLDKLQREEALREEIENLEDLRDKELESIDKQIEYWEKYKEEWASVVDEYEKQQDELLIEQELGIKLEGENWEERLENLQEYVDRYIEILEQLKDAQSQTWEDAKEDIEAGLGEEGGAGGGGGSSGIGGGTSSRPDMGNVGSAVGDIIGNIAGGTVGGIIGGVTGGIVGDAVNDVLDSLLGTSNKDSSSSSSSSSTEPSDITKFEDPALQAEVDTILSQMQANSEAWHTASPEEKERLENENLKLGNDFYTLTNRPAVRDEETGKWNILEYASGTKNATGGIALVGENGPEIRVVNDGDNIFDAESTRNLWGWASMSPGNFLSRMTQGAQEMNVTIQTLSLPSVTDGNSFINFIGNNMWRKVLQFKTSPVTT